MIESFNGMYLNSVKYRVFYSVYHKIYDEIYDSMRYKGWPHIRRIIWDPVRNSVRGFVAYSVIPLL